MNKLSRFGVVTLLALFSAGVYTAAAQNTTTTAGGNDASITGSTTTQPQQEPARRAAYRKRFDRLFPLAIKLDVNKPPRAFSWAFQFTSQLVYFMQSKGR